MDALTLKKLYESQLQEDLQPPVAPDVDRRETRYMLRLSRRMAPGTLCEDDHAGIWVWADLHLGHTKTLETFGRPFKTADEMTDQIFSNWQRMVTPEDTILILGDITVHGLWGQRLERLLPATRRRPASAATRPALDPMSGSRFHSPVLRYAWERPLRRTHGLH